MRILEFGTEHEKTVLLLHSACLSWRMFCPAVERLQTQYHLIIPACRTQREESRFISPATRFVQTRSPEAYR